MGPDDILPTFERVGAAFAARRDRSLWERPLLDWLLQAAPGPDLIDIGCGGGLPIARYLTDNGATVTCLDGAKAMLAQCRVNVPEAAHVLADMRSFDLARRFDGLIAFNSFFHLTPKDQTRAFACFSKHARRGAALVMTTGPEAGVRIGEVEGAAVYHASLSPEGYRALFTTYGWHEVVFLPESSAFQRHSIWKIRKT